MPLNCNQCKHKKFEQGDLEYCPPGWGVYFCDIHPDKNSAFPARVTDNDLKWDKCPLPKEEIL